PTHQCLRTIVEGHLGAECGDVLRQVVAAIVGLKGREPEVGRERLGLYGIMVCTIPASAWTWLVRPRKASAVTMNSAGLDAGEGNPGSVIILQKRLGVSTAVVASSIGRGCSAGWMVTQSSAREVGCWNGGARAGRKYSSSGQSLIPARRSGRVGFRRDPSDGQVSSVVDFAIPLPRRGARAYIVGVVDHSYLLTRLPWWLTLSSYDRPCDEGCVHR
ncbi:hypothetical protein BHM03_00048339, partial [Ensete ventricosum]